MHSKRAAFWGCNGVWFVNGTNWSVGPIVQKFKKTTTLLHFLESFLKKKTRGKWKMNEVLHSPGGNKYSTYNKKKESWTGHI